MHLNLYDQSCEFLSYIKLNSVKNATKTSQLSSNVGFIMITTNLPSNIFKPTGFIMVLKAFIQLK